MYHSMLDILLVYTSILVGAGMLVLNLFSVFLCRNLFYGKKKGHENDSQPNTRKEIEGVTILKPLKGVDKFLEENLRRFFLIDYPKYELVFSIVDEFDPARTIAERLMQQFPKVDARITIGGDGESVNPKINNMVPGYDSAKYGIIWICDSNAIVGNETLKGMVKLLEDKALGLVHQVPRGMEAQNLPADLEAIYYGTTHTRMYLIANCLGINCTVGKSMLFRKSSLEEIGGLKAFGKYLAEDYFIGAGIKKLGLKQAMFNEPVTQPLGECTYADYALRRIRWTRLRKNMVPIATTFEPLSESISCGLMASFGAHKLWHMHPLGFLLVYLCLWFLCDIALIQSISGRPVKCLKTFVMAWCLRELSYLPLYLYALCGNTVGWRGNCFILRPGGLVVRQNTKKEEPKLTSGLTFFEWLENFLGYPKYVTLTTSMILSVKIIVEFVYRSHSNVTSKFDDRQLYPSQELQRHKARPLVNSIWQFLQIGLSMHLQNERNFYDTNYYKMRNPTSEKFSSVASLLK